MKPYKVGDPVIYRKLKCSTHPGPRAQHVSPAPRGETYTYEVDKFWIVADRSDDQLVLETRTGKRHHVHPRDPNLRRARWWEALLYRGRFPADPDPGDPPSRGPKSAFHG